MASSSGPLHDAAWWIGRVGSQFWWLWHDIRDIWLIGTWLAGPFYEVYVRCYEVADKLDNADQRIESLSWDDFIDNFEGWAMKFLGADAVDFYYFGNDLFRFSLHKIGLSHEKAIVASVNFPGWVLWKVKDEWGFLGDIAIDPAGWIKAKIVAEFPGLAYLFEDPVRWVYYMLGSSWADTIHWKYHLLGYLIYCSGESMQNSIIWDMNPKLWIRTKVLERWPFLDNLLLDPVGWIWLKWKDSIDRYLDTHIDWLVRTVARVLNLIWQARVP